MSSKISQLAAAAQLDGTESIPILQGGSNVKATAAQFIPLIGPGFLYKFSTTTTDSNPGNGFFRGNNATLTSSTFLYIADADVNGASLRQSWQQAGALGVTVKLSQSSSVWAAFNVGGGVVNASGYTKLPVTLLASSGVLANNTATYIQADQPYVDWTARSRSQGHTLTSQTIAASNVYTTLTSAVTDIDTQGQAATGTTPFTATRAYPAVEIAFVVYGNGLGSGNVGDVWTGNILVNGVSKQAATATATVAQSSASTYDVGCGFRWRGALNSGDTVQFQVKQSNAATQTTVKFYWSVEEDSYPPTGRQFDKINLITTGGNGTIPYPASAGDSTAWRTLPGAFGNSVLPIVLARDDAGRGNGMDRIRVPTTVIFDMEWQTLAGTSSFNVALWGYSADAANVSFPTYANNQQTALKIWELDNQTPTNNGVTHTSHQLTTAEVNLMMQIPYRLQYNIYTVFKCNTADGVSQIGIYRVNLNFDYET